MAVLLALFASVTYGVADFCGGFASRQARPVQVLLLGGPVGTVLLLLVALLVGGDVLSGAVPGLLGGVAAALGLLAFYRGLAVGTMSVVAPVTALTSAAVPLATGLLRGERPGTLGMVGVVVALLAIVLVGRERRDPAAPPRDPGAGLGLALAAGVGLGVFFVFLDLPPDDTGLWPVVWARVATVAVVLGFAVRARALALPRGRTALVAGVGGVLDATANAGVLLTLRAGDLSTGSVLVSLYPAATLVLARIVLGERLAPVQRVGLGVAALGAALISL